MGVAASLGCCTTYTDVRKYAASVTHEHEMSQVPGESPALGVERVRVRNPFSKLAFR
jgi:hypothetical protein